MIRDHFTHNDTLPLRDQEAPNGLVESEVKENPLDEEPVDQLDSDSDVRLDPTQLPDHDSLRKSWSCPSQIQRNQRLILEKIFPDL